MSEVEADAPEVPPAPPPTPSDAALDRYRHRMRRSRTVYFAVVAVIVVALGVWVGVAWSRGEVAHTSLHTFTPPPPSVGVESPSQNPQVAWRTSDHIAVGFPQWGGTVITYSTHSVGGRDVRTGKPTWVYTRTDRTVCSAAQLTGTTIAIYDNGGNCDEVSAFDSGTGRRRWTRTLDKDGMPVNGRLQYQVTTFALMVYTPDVIYTIDPVTGLDRWTYERYGCRIEHAVLGSGGALVSQDCSTKVRCQKVKFCGRGPQLFLRDSSAGNGDDGTPNADKINWNAIGNTDVPVSADTLIAAARPDGTLDAFNSTKAKPDRTITLSPAPTDLSRSTAVSTASDEIVWISGQIYAIDPGSTQPDWTAASASPPTVASTTDEDIVSLPTARITVPTTSGIALVDGNDGRISEQFTVTPPPPAGSVVYSVGTGFLVAAPSGIVAYR